MSSQTQLTGLWSDDLGGRLLFSLPDEALTEQWGPLSGGPSGVADGPQVQLRRDLLSWARQDGEVRRWIVRAWRETHSDVVAAADQAVIEGLTGDAVRVLASFPPEAMLLAFLTDEFDDGRELAKTFLSQLEEDGKRRALLTVLGRLVGGDREASRRRVRLVILGGHPRDESKLGLRLFANSPFEVRWKTFEKKPSSGILQKGVVNVLRHADAALIITGMASHMLMQFAKDYAQRSGILWRCVEKATDHQLKAALHELFPDLTVEWSGQSMK